MKMLNTYIRSKIKYGCLIWNPQKKEDIDMIEIIQKNFTGKISDLEEINYHDRLNKLLIYSLERKRERFLIINAWQQLEGIKENVLKLERGREQRYHCNES